MLESIQGGTAAKPAPSPERRNGFTAGLKKRRCAGCRAWFRPGRHNQVRCRPDCGRVRPDQVRDPATRHRARAQRRAEGLRFVAIDGEGVTDPATGEHRYVLLSCGESVLEEGGSHLGIETILDFLWDCFTDDPAAAYVGFYLSYDFGQWLRSLTAERATMLLSKEGLAKRQRKSKRPGGESLPPWPVDVGPWEVDYLYGRRLKLRPAGEPPPGAPSKLVTINTVTSEDGVTRKIRRWAWMYVCDSGAYFQSSFLKAVDPRGNPNPVVTLEEYALLERGKENRGKALELDAEMIEYNRLECAALERLMQQLETGMREEGLKLGRAKWFGPGQLAQAWMTKIAVPKGAQVREVTPEAVRAAAQSSYMGGWFELFWHGPVEGDSYTYDINSAYPYIMAGLPCLLHGHWRHEAFELKSGKAGRRLLREEKALLGAEGLELVRAYVQGHHPLVGAMQHRMKNGTIVRPKQTCAWYWAHELAAAIGASFVDEVRVFERWRFEARCDCPPPVAPIAELYQRRLALEKDSPAGKARKLIYNSCAGKFQQSVGMPAFGNAIYGSLITAGCRALIADAIGTHPKGGRSGLCMVATDGVTFREPHTGLSLSKRLGDWSETRHEELCLFRPGVYWDDAARERLKAGEAPIFKSRGIPARDIAKRIPILDRAWARYRRDGWPRLLLPIAFQVTSPAQALDRGDWSQCGQVILNQPRMITSDPIAKRYSTGPGQHSRPYDRVRGDLESHGYDGAFGDELTAWSNKEFGDSPDGAPGDLLAELIMGG